MLNASGICQDQYYVVRIEAQLALVYQRDLPHGKDWGQFTRIDLWQALSLKDVLAEIVYDQAQRLPQIACREDA